MIFLSVVRNKDTQEWEILRVISNPINVRGNLTGITYGDIRVLDLETQIAEGFWTQNDVYENTGEYMEFKEKLVDFDEVKGIVTNTYVYQRMDLEVIKQDLEGRAKSYRDMLISSGFEDESGNVFDTSLEGRQNLSALVSYILINPQVESVTVALPSDVEIVLPVAKLEDAFSKMMELQQQLYVKCRTIRDAIKVTSTYEDARAAAKWDDTPL